MQSLVLEINDIGLSVASRERVIACSPGQIICGADFARGKMLIGQAAADQRRINPRATHDRFWGWLNSAPLARPVGRARSHADLAWMHLRDLLEQVPGDDKRWLLLVPSQLDDTQLALLLGIAQNLGLNVAGLVAAPLAGAAAAAVERDCLVLDAQWHRFSADRVSRDQQLWRMHAPAPIKGRGLGALMDSWARLAGEAFVTQTRFDPSHDAEIEQRLYSQLPEWMERLSREPSVVVELGVGTHRYTAELSAKPFVDAAQPFYRPLLDRIAQQPDCSLVLRHRLAGLPGLSALLDQQGAGDVVVLDEHSPAQQVLDRADWIAVDSPDGIAHVVQMPVDDAAAPTELQVSVDESVPSHVLVDGRAMPIGRHGVGLDEQADGWRIERQAGGQVMLVGGAQGLNEAWLNDQAAVPPSPLSMGDRVRVGPREFLLLRVQGDGST
ncbi:MAG: hypothetical protein RQ741_11250 [Wenzhouxiangellaceae bacterium]|nr:hypothetical protein [Wenzhouxiangellaceae bacterium]